MRQAQSTFDVLLHLFFFFAFSPSVYTTDNNNTPNQIQIPIICTQFVFISSIFNKQSD